MFVIEGSMMKVIQGDTGEFELTLDNYEFVEGDKVYMTVKKNPKDVGTVFQKVVTTFSGNKAKIKLEHEDTNLEQGKYFYDIQCSLLDGRIDTVIPPSPFFVLEGITDVK